MKYTILIYVFILNSIFAQTDWDYWSKAETNYSINNREAKQNQTEEESSLLSVLKDGYSFFISDLDGDNCPFNPTCSNFFVSSIAETNIFQGTLMFADRFTRDSNLFKSHSQYKVLSSGKLYDPVQNHLLLESSIIKYNSYIDK